MMFTLGARSLGAFLLVLFFGAMLAVMKGDLDPRDARSPEELYKGIVPFLSYMVLAWWLLFR
jgi:hypothetical protein